MREVTKNSLEDTERKTQSERKETEIHQKGKITYIKKGNKDKSKEARISVGKFNKRSKRILRGESVSLTAEN